jgi:hypothetical protein
MHERFYFHYYYYFVHLYPRAIIHYIYIYIYMLLVWLNHTHGSRTSCIHTSSVIYDQLIISFKRHTWIYTYIDKIMYIYIYLQLYTWLCLGVTVYHLWRHRNDLIHSETPRSEKAIWLRSSGMWVSGPGDSSRQI